MVLTSGIKNKYIIGININFSDIINVFEFLSKIL